MCSSDLSVLIRELRSIVGDCSGSVNMAAAAGRILSFSRNAKVLVSPLKMSAVSAPRHYVTVSSTGEAITHTGQVRPRLARQVTSSCSLSQ